MQGISTNRHADSSATCLLQAGYQFVIRYHSRTTTQPQKRLTPKEAAELARAGLKIATVYQDNARLPMDFGATRGALDANSAYVYAGQVGQPDGSAIYFAVDTDFSRAQINSFIIPYFQAIKRVFTQLANNGIKLRIGVYGSGLVCRMLKYDLSLVELSWLAEATGWRESSIYQDWNVKQIRNDGEALCNVGVYWQGCVGNDNFGQFVPIGFDVTAELGSSAWVTASELNLRTAPSDKVEVFARLAQTQEVKVLGEANDQWVRVRAFVNGAKYIGYVAKRFLATSQPQATSLTDLVVGLQAPGVHMPTSGGGGKRSVAGRWAQPLAELGQPTRDPNSNAAVKVQSLTAIGDWLNVETSPRYRQLVDQETGSVTTFCNIYAHDFCYLANVYLPRVWWTSKAIASFAAGKPLNPAYGVTVGELNADALFAWLNQYGPQFGWRRVADLSALQASANDGGLGIICGDRAAVGRPGHITVVIPETAAHKAQRDADGNVLEPFQTQAGSNNYRWGSAGPSWWKRSPGYFKDYGYFVND